MDGDSMSRFELQWHITSAYEDKIIKDFLREKEISKTAVTDIKFKGGYIEVNGQAETVRYKLKQGDRLTVGFPIEEISEGIKSEALPLDILYEDDYLIAVNKSAGMSTIPSREHPSGSLANALMGYYEQINLTATVHIATRLDRDTSGIVLIAKHRHIHHLLSKQQRAGEIDREYEAFAEGDLKQDRGTIIEPIARKSDSIIERRVHPDGQYACTHFEVINRSNCHTHVKLKLETGRTHQIRVHMSHIGHPLAGDDLYGGKVDFISRQALHCRRISFYHPILEKKLVFVQEMPNDMKNLLR